MSTVTGKLIVVTMLWSVSVYALCRAADSVQSVVDVAALFTTNVNLVYIMSWVFLQKQFVSVRVCSLAENLCVQKSARLYVYIKNDFVVNIRASGESGVLKNRLSRWLFVRLCRFFVFFLILKPFNLFRPSFLPAGCHGNLPVLNLLSASVAKNQHFRPCRKNYALDRKMIDTC